MLIQDGVRSFRSDLSSLSCSEGDIIRDIPTTITTSAIPNLLLGDGLYLTTRLFRLVRQTHGRHILVKFPAKKERPDLIKTALVRFSSVFYDDVVERTSGFDNQRFCSYTMQATTDTYAGSSVQVIRVCEYSIKRQSRTSFWIITTDMDLTLAAAREAAHLRWSIENGGFKTWSHLAGTQRLVSHDPITATHFLNCVTTAVVLLMLIRIFLNHSRYQIPPAYQIVHTTIKAWIKLILDALGRAAVFR